MKHLYSRRQMIHLKLIVLFVENDSDVKHKASERIRKVSLGDSQGAGRVWLSPPLLSVPTTRPSFTE